MCVCVHACLHACLRVNVLTCILESHERILLGSIA